MANPALAHVMLTGASVCKSVHKYVCRPMAMRFIVFYGIKLKLGMGVGDRPTRFERLDLTLTCC